MSLAAAPRSESALPNRPRPDPVLAGALRPIGGLPGRHARRTAGWWTPLRVLLALTLLTMVAAWAQKASCRDGVWVHDKQYAQVCYSDVIALYGSEGLAAGRTPYLDVPVEYPVGIGALMAVASAAARWWPEADRYPAFYGLTWIELTVAALVVVATTAGLAGRRRWDAAMVATAPGLLLAAMINWDLAAAALAGTAMLAWARRRPTLAGILLGLAIATKFYPGVFLVPLFALCLRTGRLRQWAITTGAAVGTLVLVTVPGYVAAPAFAIPADGAPVAVAPGAWSVLRTGGIDAFVAALAPHRGGGSNALLRFVELNTTRPADWGSVWFALAQLTGHPLDPVVPVGGAPGRLNAVVFLGLALTLAGVCALALLAPRRPRLPQLIFLALVGFLLTNKVYSPQYLIWLLPLAVLARPSWRAVLAWQATEVVAVVGVMYMLLGLSHPGPAPGAGLPTSGYLVTLLIRDAMVLVLAALVVRDVLAPERDLVRADGADDPAGGVLDGAADRWPASRRRAAGGTGAAAAGSVGR